MVRPTTPPWLCDMANGLGVGWGGAVLCTLRLLELDNEIIANWT